MRTPLVLRIVFWVWLIAAVVFSQSLLAQRISLPTLQGVLLALTAALVLAYRKLGGFRAWVDALDVRSLVLLHVTRFVGFYLLVLFQRGVLPYAVAVPGGIADILVAAAALAIVFLPLGESARLRALSIWNVVGLIEILLVLVTALRLGVAAPGQLRALTQLPLSLLPTFLVPLLLATHLAIFARLARRTEPSA